MVVAEDHDQVDDNRHAILPSSSWKRTFNFLFRGIVLYGEHDNVLDGHGGGDVSSDRQSNGWVYFCEGVEVH